MRAAIVSDIHSNLEAFQAVLEDAEGRGGVDELWCLGDLVGYGPNPREVIQTLRQYPNLIVAGNHDWAATGKIDTSMFNPHAGAAALWTATQLTTEEVNFLNGLPLTATKGDFTLAHGSPRDPIWEYLLSETAALANLDHFSTPLCLVGHSHLPFICYLDRPTMKCVFSNFPVDEPVKLNIGRLILNPGGVGQPRDRDPTASYAIFDGAQGTICHHRVPYDIPVTQEKMRRAGLPERLINRLSYGI